MVSFSSEIFLSPDILEVLYILEQAFPHAVRNIAKSFTVISLVLMPKLFTVYQDINLHTIG